MDYLEKLKKQINRMTPVERVILEAIIRREENIGEISVAEIAYAASVSNAAVIKFSKKLGFSGFDEFKYYVKFANYNSEIEPIYAHTKNVFLKNNISSMLVNKNILVLAEGLSIFIAEDFANKLVKLETSNIVAFKSSEITNIEEVKSTYDCVIFISSSGNSLLQCKIATELKELETIAITNVKGKISNKVKTPIILNNNEMNDFEIQFPWKTKYSLTFFMDFLFNEIYKKYTK